MQCPHKINRHILIGVLKSSGQLTMQVEIGGDDFGIVEIIPTGRLWQSFQVSLGVHREVKTSLKSGYSCRLWRNLSTGPQELKLTYRNQGYLVSLTIYLLKTQIIYYIFDSQTIHIFCQINI